MDWRIWRVAFWVVLWTAGGHAAELPDQLTTPDRGVLCNVPRAACYDRWGLSLGLTEAFLGKDAADALLAAVRDAGPVSGPGVMFSPIEGIVCVGETGPCRASAELASAIAAVLYPDAQPALAVDPALMGTVWHWQGSFYGNDDDARPSDPGRYVLRLAPDGSLQVQADCNSAGGVWRGDSSSLTLEVRHSTMAACAPESLDGVFLRDLAAVTHYLLREGMLHLDMRYDTGSMRFVQ